MTLWPFQNVICFSAPYTRNFVAPRCSAAYVLTLFCFVALFLLPLFATFASDNMWLKESQYREQPMTRFTHELFVVLAGSFSFEAVGWTTTPNLEALLPSQIRVPVVRSSAHDDNYDGVPDTWRLVLQMPPGNFSGFQRLFLLASYDLEVREKVVEKIGALVALDLSSALPASGVWIQGRLRLRQDLPLRVAGAASNSELAQNALHVDWRSNWAAKNQPLTARALLERHAAKPVAAVFEQELPPVWDYMPTHDSFKVELVMHVPPQLIQIVPTAAEVLKFAWMQVISFAIPIWIALQSLKTFAFDSQIVETYVISELPAKDAT